MASLENIFLIVIIIIVIVIVIQCAGNWQHCVLPRGGVPAATTRSAFST